MLITAAILRVLWTSVVASMVVTIAFSLGILGLVRWSEVRSDGRRAEASAYALLAALALVAFVAAVVYGLILLTQKS
jgi:uncharacterized membrane protein YidH (DUF202 family)